MGVYEREYMRERERKRYLKWLNSPAQGKRSSSLGDPPWMRIIVWLCIAAAVTAWGVREYERRHPKPPKRVIRSPEVAEPKQEDEKPAKPFDFFRQAPR